MSNLSVNSITNAAGGNTATINGMTPTADSLQGFRNRIINGDMRIDQRNAGAAVTFTGASIAFIVDRFGGFEDTDGVMTGQQDSSAPPGFTNSVKVTTTTADTSLATTQNCVVVQNVEGFNVADLGWGSASAKTVTISFWVKASLTGTFGGSLRNSAADRSYPFTYTISVADTWEQKSVTIAGDTSGTWLTTNGVGIRLTFSMGAGPDRSGTAGAWAAANYVSATGAVSVIGTLNATWQITGVQLEAGSVATPFERRPFGTELALCQRYLPAYVGNNNMVCNGSGFDANNTRLRVSFPVQVRVAATGIVVSSAAHFSIQTGSGSLTACGSLSFGSSGLNGAAIGANHSGGGATNAGTALFSNNDSAVLYFTGCEL